ncbi:hypothetical protein FQN57_003974 [Myotisia sp. PD_48]|nr:hypothetical protein FQN57_003974 [Myotisia sp. PD_48]
MAIVSLPSTILVRLFYHLYSRIRFHKHNPELEMRGPSKEIHPAFAPASLMSRTSLWETDYNLHKSNSTYFSDLDISRTVLVTDLYTPGMELVRREMEKEVDRHGKRKYPGRITVMLGSVYCCFKKEIKPYEKYEMQSKIVAWDEKWAYIMTFFLRPSKRKSQPKTLLAVGVSKYVVKKGRMTVRPERVLRASGLLPPRPIGQEESPSPATTLETPASGEGIDTGESMDEPLLRQVLTLTEDADIDQAVLDNKKKFEDSAKSSGWDWHKIEQERLRGMSVVRAFVDIDAKLHEEAQL